MSKFTKTPLTEATDAEIRDFCELQQLDVDSCRSRADLLAALGPVWEHDYIPTTRQAALEADEAAAQAQQTQAVVTHASRLVGGLGDKDPVFRLRIGTTSMPGGKEPVPVGVNGKTVVIQRNVDVDVPARYFFALENAIREEVTQDPKTGEIDVTEVTNYPFNVITRPEPEEIAAWREQTDKLLMPA